MALSGPLSTPYGLGNIGNASLKDKQRAAVFKMLNFNQDPSEKGNDGTWSDQWKVLIYDRPCRDIISTLANVAQLRKQGVTLHLLLESDREAIQDVPALYFCEPSADTTRRIAQDLSKRLYASFHLNFSTKVERPLLESFARDALACGGVSLISKIYDQYLHFVTLEPRLFTLNQADSFLSYNDPAAPDTSVEHSMKSATYGIFSVLATLQSVPVIRAPMSGAGQMVAEELRKLISDSLTTGGSSGGGVFGNQKAYNRPLLIVIDRSADLVTPLRHTSTYQALLDDVLEHRVNRVTVDIEGKPGQPATKKRKTYDVDCETDTFYSRLKGSPFPEAIDANATELAAVTQREEDIRRRTTGGVGGEGGMGAGKGVGMGGPTGASDLATAVESLPALLEQKKGLEMHTNILKAVMDVVAARHVPVFFAAEEEMMLTNRADKAALSQLLGGAVGSLADKLRLLAVYCLTIHPSAAEVSELTTVLRSAVMAGEGGAGMENAVDRGIAAISYLRKVAAMQRMPNTSNADTSSARGGGMGEPPRSDRGGGAKFVQGLLAKAQNQGLGLLAKAAQTAGQLLSRANKTYVVRLVETLLDHNEDEQEQAFSYIDPMLKGGGARGVDPSLANHSRPPFRDIIVFVVGGGCYTEYQNLQDLAQRRSTTGGGPISITYGCTEMLNGENFLSQLERLGQRST